jgi:5-methylthioadenosine/S-adenosylhomocysteine deaminase
MQSKATADLLIEARWLLPVAPSNTALSGHAVVVVDGRIAAVGPVEALAAGFAPRERVVRADHVVLPGFVNAHTCAAMSLFRGLPVAAPLSRWQRETILPAEQRCLSPDFARDGTQLAIAEMLRAGITAFGDLYQYPEETARVAAAARVRAVIGLPIAESPSAWAENATAHLAKAERMWDEYRENPWVSLQFAPHPPHAVGDATLTRVRSVADELDARVAMHVHETELEVRDSLGHYGRRPLRRLGDLGLLRPGFTALHMNRVDADDQELAARTGIAVVACPQSNLRLGSGSCPVTALLKRNVNVGFGTGSPPSAGAFDLLAEARTAALLSSGIRGAGNENPALSSAEALTLATLGGATALGLGSRIGSLEVGKAADLVCIDLATLGCQTSQTVADTLLFAATRQHVSDVWVAGRAAVANGRLLAFDEQELKHLARRWADRVLELS